MKTLFEILASLIKPLFNGIRVVLTGGFGWRAAMIAWLLSAYQIRLAYLHSNGLVNVVMLSAMLVVLQAAAALWSLAVISSATTASPSKKVSPFDKIVVQAMVSAAIIVFVSIYVVGGLLALIHFLSIRNCFGLALDGAAVAALSAHCLAEQFQTQVKKAAYRAK